MSSLEFFFWLSIAGVFYIYAGYPALIAFMARFFSRPVKKSDNNYSVSIIISVYNEAPKLVEKINNILSSDGSERIAEILIGSDGSDDDPKKAVESIKSSRIKLVAFPKRRGKPSVLNDLIAMAQGDILVMMDIRQRLDKKAITALLENFSDPSVGVVSGELMFERSDSDTSAADSIDAYWRYEKWIRNTESRYHSVPGATGALYAMRRKLAQPIPSGAALDDVLLPMQAIAQGYRCIFEPGAKIYDRPAQDSSREAIRKRRTLAGCVQLMRYHPLWVNPGCHPIWWQYGSHKIARMYSPFLMAAALILNWCLISQPIYLALAIAQSGMWGLGIYRAVKPAQSGGIITRLASWIGVFLIMQYNTLCAWRDGLLHRDLAMWKKA